MTWLDLEQSQDKGKTYCRLASRFEVGPPLHTHVVDYIVERNIEFNMIEHLRIVLHPVAATDNHGREFLDFVIARTHTRFLYCSSHFFRVPGSFKRFGGHPIGDEEGL